MACPITGRGWASDADSGANTSYYLHTGVWYFMLSPNNYWSDNHSNVLNVNDIGNLRSNWVNNTGGVRSIFQMLNKIVKIYNNCYGEILAFQE